MNSDPNSERVYDFKNGSQENAEAMYKRLRLEGLNPQWDSGVRDGVYCYGISLPSDEVAKLHELQRSNPARWGNSPEANTANAAWQADAQAQAKIDADRRAVLTGDQLDFIEILHQQTGLDGSSALELNETLHELAAQHLVLKAADLNEGLSVDQERALEAIEERIGQALEGISGIKGVRFLDDPRGTTVGIYFDTAMNSVTGTWKVPLNPERVKALQAEGPSFWDAQAAGASAKP